MSKFTIGVDFGTESGRAVVVDLFNGKEIENAVTEYTHGVLDEKLPDGTVLLDDWALQHPEDYIEVLMIAVPEAIRKANVDPQNVIGISIDFTSCTMLPVDELNQPLCLHENLKAKPHSWIKLWKHHAAQPQANELNRILEKKEPHVLARYGGKQSSEWMIAKIMQILEEDPEVYEQTDQFLEATDWVTSQMTGVVKKNSCTAGYKAIWHKRDGYLQPETLGELSPQLVNLYETKLRGEVYPQGEKAGELQPEMAEKMNLPAGIAVAVGNVDAHVSVPAMGVTQEEEMVMVMGTSTCHVLLGKNESAVEGMCGVVEDGVIPGFYGYEAGQPGVGDIFNWFVENYSSEDVQEEARQQGRNIHQLLEEKASRLTPGESGLLALDWMNGNRSILVDVDLTGMILGLTISTKPEEIYRALIEATAFGTYRIMNSFEESGVPIQRLYACGGLPFKNKMLMQIYSDVTNRPIYTGESEQLPAVGSAMFAAVAAGKEAGGYTDIEEAANNMARLRPEVYWPNQENHAIYQKLYDEYNHLHDYFGRGENDVLKRLRRLKKNACVGQ